MSAGKDPERLVAEALQAQAAVAADPAHANPPDDDPQDPTDLVSVKPRQDVVSHSRAGAEAAGDDGAHGEGEVGGNEQGDGDGGDSAEGEGGAGEQVEGDEQETVVVPALAVPPPAALEFGLLAGTDRGYELLSGTDTESTGPTGSTESTNPADSTDSTDSTDSYVQRSADARTVDLSAYLRPSTRPMATTSARPQLSVWWILLLAVLLGLAAGAVVGVLTVL